MILDQLHMGKMSRKMAVFGKSVRFPQFPIKVALLKAASAATTGQRMKIAGDLGCSRMNPLVGD
jgi:hypothetical protein